jgi:hypothetical protein
MKLRRSTPFLARLTGCTFSRRVLQEPTFFILQLPTSFLTIESFAKFRVLHSVTPDSFFSSFPPSNEIYYSVWSRCW